MDLARNGYNIIKGSDDYESAGKRNFTTKAGTFGSDGLFEDLNQYVWLSTQHLVDLTRFDDFGLYLEIAKIETFVTVIVDRLLCKFQ